jgi:hypothetical protein
MTCADPTSPHCAGYLVDSGSSGGGDRDYSPAFLLMAGLLLLDLGCVATIKFVLLALLFPFSFSSSSLSVSSFSSFFFSFSSFFFSFSFPQDPLSSPAQ